MNRLEARPPSDVAELEPVEVEVQLGAVLDELDDDEYAAGWAGEPDRDRAGDHPVDSPAPPLDLPIHHLGPDGEGAAPSGHSPRNGRLAVEVPAGASALVVLALDADGQVLASSDLPLENDLPSEVFLDLLASGLPAAGLEGVDLHVRVTPELAKALAAAVRAAQSSPRGSSARPCASGPLAAARRR
jgi:hypothetical protein